MANTIRIKRSTGSSAPSSLANAELAYAEGSNILYYGTGTGGAGGSATSIEAVGGDGAFFDKTTSQTANYVLAAPNGSAGAATYRALVVADIPTLTASKVSDFDTQVRTSRLDQLASATAVVSGVTPTADAHLATKGYVDSTAQGLDVKDSCKVATTANITLANTQTVDDISLTANDRVLVKDQSTASENGLYKVVDGGSWTRTDDLATGADAAGAFTFVEQGSTYSDVGFVCSSNKGSAVTGTNNLAFTQFSGVAGVTAGNGIDKSGNEISLDLKANGGLVIESTEACVDLSASSITGTLAIGDGGTGATSASAARSALGLASGTNVQAYDAQLADVAGLAVTDGGFIVGNGSNFVLETGATARTSIGAQTLATDLTNLSSCQSGGSSALAALTSTEIEILDGATVTTSELNTCCDGGTSATSTTLATADRMVINDAGTMVQVALSDLVTFLENGSVSGFELDGGTF